VVRSGKKLLESIVAFRKAANGLYGDDEHDAAVGMADSALAFMRDAVVCGVIPAELARSFARVTEDGEN
jgi:hypothetical protein